MLDIKVIRENLDWSKKKLATRGIKPEELDELVEIDTKRRKDLTKSEQLKAKRNDVSKQIAEKKRNKEDASDAIAVASSSLIFSIIAVSSVINLPLVRSECTRFSRSNSASAFCMVLGFTPASVAKSRTEGSLAPGLYLPAMMSREILSTICV